MLAWLPTNEWHLHNVFICLGSDTTIPKQLWCMNKALVAKLNDKMTYRKPKTVMNLSEFEYTITT